MEADFSSCSWRNAATVCPKSLQMQPPEPWHGRSLLSQRTRTFSVMLGRVGGGPPAPTNQTWVLLPDPNLPPTPQIPEFRSLLGFRGMCQHPTSGSKMPTFVADWNLFLSSVKKNPNHHPKQSNLPKHTHKGNQQVETTSPTLLAPQARSQPS